MTGTTARMSTRVMSRSMRSVLQGRCGGALLVLGAVCLLPLACGEHTTTVPLPGESPEEILQEALGSLGTLVPVKLDTAALASAVQAGQSIRLPFAEEGGQLVQRDVHLILRNLRAPDLVEFVLKDGVQQQGHTQPLPPPATYQGIVAAQGGGQPGAAVLTITAQVVAGNLLVAPDGWSIIEPLEPMLRLRGVEPARRQRVLGKYNHVVYNSRDTRLPQPSSSGAALAASPADSHATAVGQPPTPLVLSIVGDGDAELFQAYPLDSVMPFWLMQETLFNAIDWLYNCVEPDANPDNAYTVCDNHFDGGAGAFQARLRIDRLETWTAGGPTANSAGELMVESARFTHQSTPVCCGEPHTAGQSSLVHFFTGKAFPGSAGNASVGGLNVYGDGCEQPLASFCCHHGVSQIVPGNGTPGTLFQVQLLMAHEIGHNTGGEEDRFGYAQDWLFGEKSGPTLMYSGFDGFPAEEVFVYASDVAANKIGPLLAQRLGEAPDVTTSCDSAPVM